MTEEEYIILGNKVKIDSATKILSDILPGDEYGINQAKIRKIFIMIESLSDEVSDKIIIDMDDLK